MVYFSAPFSMSDLVFFLNSITIAELWYFLVCTDLNYQCSGMFWKNTVQIQVMTISLFRHF